MDEGNRHVVGGGVVLGVADVEREFGTAANIQRWAVPPNPMLVSEAEDHFIESCLDAGEGDSGSAMFLCASE